MPRQVGIRELRNQVAAVVRAAAGGEAMVVTVDGVPRAQLGPIDPATSGLTLELLVCAGLVRPPSADRRPADPAVEAIPVDLDPGQVLAELRGR